MFAKATNRGAEAMAEKSGANPWPRKCSQQLGNRLPFHVEIANAFPEVSAVVGRPRVGRGAEFPQLLLLQREVPRQYLVRVDVIVVFAECEDLHLSLDDGVEAFSKVIIWTVSNSAIFCQKFCAECRIFLTRPPKFRQTPI